MSKEIESISSLAKEDIGIEPDKNTFIKESHVPVVRPNPADWIISFKQLESTTAEARESINSGLNIFWESVILQVLETKGVKNIPRVVRDEKGLPKSQSGYIKKKTKAGYFFTSIGIERIQGENLASHEFSSEKEVIEVGKQAANTFQQIYDAGFVHTDIKPQNIMISPDNKIYVVDFNAAVPHNAKGEFHAFAATEEYVAPERKTGSYTVGKEPVDHVTQEIYSLALTLAETLGIGIDSLSDTNIAPEFRRHKFVEQLQKSVESGDLSEKMALFLAWETADDPINRSSSFKEFEETLELIENSTVTTQQLLNHFVEQAEKRDGAHKDNETF